MPQSILPKKLTILHLIDKFGETENMLDQKCSSLLSAEDLDDIQGHSIWFVTESIFFHLFIVKFKTELVFSEEISSYQLPDFLYVIFSYNRNDVCLFLPDGQARKKRPDVDFPLLLILQSVRAQPRMRVIQ